MDVKSRADKKLETMTATMVSQKAVPFPGLVGGWFTACFGEFDCGVDIFKEGCKRVSTAQSFILNVDFVLKPENLSAIRFTDVF